MFFFLKEGGENNRNNNVPPPRIFPFPPGTITYQYGNPMDVGLRTATDILQYSRFGLRDSDVDSARRRKAP